jgi:rhamnose transport system substrate-binding protein
MENRPMRFRRRSILAMVPLAAMIAPGAAFATDKITMQVIPKLIGIPYFASTGEGAKAAGEELGLDLNYNGPTDASVEGQISIINQAIRRNVNIIAIAATDANAVAPSLKKARQAGITVVSWDSDVAKDARSFYVEATSSAGMAKGLIESLVQDGLTEGSIAVLTGSATAANLIAYINNMKAYIAANHPKLSIATVLAGDEDAVKSKAVTQSYFQGNPGTKGLIVTGSAMTPGLEALKDLGLLGKVKVAGFGLPSVNGGQTKDGTLSRFLLWNPVDLGYAAVYVGVAAYKGTLKVGSTEVDAGHLGKLEVGADIVTLGPPFVFDGSNVDKFKF